jgi:dipeptide/tripeptide permease
MYVINVGLCYTIPVVAGRIADLFAGRFNTIYGSLLIGLVGKCLMEIILSP